MKNLDRRKFILTTFAAIAGLILIGQNLLAQTDKNAQVPTLKGKKVLFVWGGWSGHEPKQSVDIYVPWMKSEGAEVVVSDKLDSYLDESLMGSLDLVIQMWTMGKITKEQSDGLLKAIKRGVGLAGWHGGLGDSFRENVDYQFMVGPSRYLDPDYGSCQQSPAGSRPSKNRGFAAKEPGVKTSLS